jgi:16S rRNA (cytosine1402-N4)-methyltransferase
MSVAAEPRHVSVLPQEVIELLDPQPGEVWVDATTGAGGHTRQIAERVGPNGRVFALDQDAKMLELAATRLAGLPVRLIQANFDQLLEVLAGENITQVNGLLADLGFCSDQLDDATRGLSFREDGPLDMRLDTSTGQTAAELVNTMSEEGLADVFYEFGEERKSRWVAKRIVERRREQKFSRTGELAELVRSTVPRSGGIDPATRVFQALRIAVNDELGALDRLLGMLPEIVATGGRVGMISFHSLEDRRVKQAFRDQAFWSVRTKKPVEASEAEVARNPRSRSAKFRVAVRSG